MGASDGVQDWVSRDLTKTKWGVPKTASSDGMNGVFEVREPESVRLGRTRQRGPPGYHDMSGSGLSTASSLGSETAGEELPVRSHGTICSGRRWAVGMFRACLSYSLCNKRDPRELLEPAWSSFWVQLCSRGFTNSSSPAASLNHGRANLGSVPRHSQPDGGRVQQAARKV
jgi:hypothetical protein